MDDMIKTVLVVDDEEEMTRLLRIELEQEGYQTFIAHDGDEGFQRIRQHKPDVIILDIMMPGMDGYEMVKKLKLSEETRNIPVIFLTAKANEKDIQKGKEMGADLYITKPFDSVKLIENIRRLLGGK